MHLLFLFVIIVLWICNAWCFYFHKKKVLKNYVRNELGPVVRRPISANSGLNFNLGFFLFCSKTFSQIIFSILFRASNHQIVGKKNKTEFAFKLSYLNSNFALTLGYLNHALNNPALICENAVAWTKYWVMSSLN